MRVGKSSRSATNLATGGKYGLAQRPFPRSPTASEYKPAESLRKYAAGNGAEKKVSNQSWMAAFHPYCSFIAHERIFEVLNNVPAPEGTVFGSGSNSGQK